MSWICPHCGTTATLQKSDANINKSSVIIGTASEQEGISIAWCAIKCPSKTCEKFILDIDAHFGRFVPNTSFVSVDKTRPVGVGAFRFEPRIGTPMSKHVPKVVVDDYTEACLIKDLSPKAAATLCRRALQGMVRDFWGITKRTLALELEAIETLCDAELFAAMSAVRSIGNIGAHPERNIDLIIEVEEGEVESLLSLLHILDKEWYVARAAKADRLAAIIALGVEKASQKIAAKTTSGTPSTIATE